MENNFLGTVSAVLERCSTVTHSLAAVEKINKWINVVGNNSYPRNKPVGAFLDDLNSGESVTRIQANLPGQGRFGKTITPSGDDDLLAAWSCPSVTSSTRRT